MQTFQIYRRPREIHEGGYLSLSVLRREFLPAIVASRVPGFPKVIIGKRVCSSAITGHAMIGGDNDIFIGFVLGLCS